MEITDCSSNTQEKYRDPRNNGDGAKSFVAIDSHGTKDEASDVPVEIYPGSCTRKGRNIKPPVRLNL